MCPPNFAQSVDCPRTLEREVDLFVKPNPLHFVGESGPGRQVGRGDNGSINLKINNCESTPQQRQELITGKILSNSIFFGDLDTQGEIECPGRNANLECEVRFAMSFECDLADNENVVSRYHNHR